METPMERARELVARYDHTDVSELSGMNADTRRIAAIAAAGLALRDAVQKADEWADDSTDFRMTMQRQGDIYDAAIAKAVAEGAGE